MGAVYRRYHQKHKELRAQRAAELERRALEFQEAEMRDRKAALGVQDQPQATAQPTQEPQPAAPIDKPAEPTAEAADDPHETLDQRHRTHGHHEGHDRRRPRRGS